MIVNGFPQDYFGNQHGWWLGRVIGITETQLEPEQQKNSDDRNRVRVRIFGHSGPEAEMDPKDCPLADVLMPPTHGYGWPGGIGQTHGLKIMDLVTGFYLDHDQQHPVVTGVFMGGILEKEYDEPLGYTGSGSVGNSTFGAGSGASSQSTSTTAANQNTDPAAGKKANNTSAQGEAARSSSSSESSSATSSPPTVVSTRADGVEFSDNGVQGGAADRTIPATIRHNNPLGNNQAGLANRYDTVSAGQNLDGTNTIASFADTSDGYGYSFHQMHLNATRAGRIDEQGRLYTTPTLVGNEHYTAGYNGETISNAVGHNNRMYFDTFNNDWVQTIEAMQVRETGKSLRTKALTNNNLSSTYDFGQNTKQMSIGFEKMQKNTGIR